MTNTVSHHKVWMARIAGLFVLTALAAMYLVFPMISMAKITQNVTPLAKGYKVDFMGEILAPGTKDMPITTASTSNATINLARVSQFPLTEVKKGAWFACNVTGPDNQAYPFTCTVDTISKNDPTQITVVFGQSGNSLMTSPTILQAVIGHSASLTIPTDAAKTNATVLPGLANTGWGQIGALPTK